MRVDWERELHVSRHDVAGDAGEAELLGLVQGLAVDRVARGEANPPVVPRRLRIPLLDEVEEDHRVGPDGAQLEPRRPLDVLRHGTAEEIDDVGVTTLEGGRARRLVRDALEDQPLHARRLAPVPVERFDDDLDAGCRADEPVGAGADRRPLEAVVADLLDVLLRHDPAGAGRGGAIEGHEVGPRLMEHELHPAGIEDLYVLHLLLQEFRGAALVAVERELDVLGGHGLAVVELDVLTQHERVGEAVLRHRPRLGEARRGLPGGHRLHQRVVDRVEHLERRDRGLGLTGIEPAGRQGHVEGVGDLSFRCRFERRERRDECRDGRDERA